MGIHIFWDSRVPSGLAQPATEEMSSVLNTAVSRIDGGTFPLEGYDASRGQYDAMKILSKIDLFRSLHPELFKPEKMSMDFFSQHCHLYEKVLLVTSEDLYTPRNNFVFGLAHIKLGVAVVSAARLTNVFYGRHPDDYALIKRIVTEGCHEIAHLCGLEHCSNPGCIMYCPNNLDDLDRKDTFFCGKCRLELENGVRRSTY